MHPVLDGRMAHRRYSLCYLALMVGEHEIHAATMDVERLTQIFAPHSRTLAVPARETVAPR